MKKLTLLITGLLLFSIASQAQVSILNGGQIDLNCDQLDTLIYDIDNNAYPPGTNSVVTVCPGLSGSVVGIVFFQGPPNFIWNIPDGDIVNIYDGNSTAAPLLGSFNSVTDPNGFQLQSSGIPVNPGGCITFELISDANGNGGNIAGALNCGNTWQPFEPVITTSLPTDLSGDTIDLCFPTTVDLNASGNFSWMPGDPGYEQTDANSYFTWFMGDGTVYEGLGLTDVVHDYGGQFGYYAIVQVQDAEGQIERDSIVVRYSTTPSFAGVYPHQDTICAGEMIDIQYGEVESNGDITPGINPTEGTYFFGGLFGEQLYIPDWSGVITPYQTTILVDGFLPGSTITSINDIVEVCVNMEHSFLGDLEMQLICPDGTAVTLFDAHDGTGSYPGVIPGGFNPGGVFLGEPIDPGLGAGIGYTYCFSMGNTDYDDFETEWMNGWPGTVPAGSYQPMGNFADFIGCPVNGPWTIEVYDNWAIDDGYIFNWNIQLDQALNPDAETYIPTLIDLQWAEDPNNPVSNTIITAITDTAFTIQPSQSGTYNYIATVTDNFGCSYDTTITVTVGNIPDISIIDDLTIDCDATVELSVEIDGVPPPPADCIYTLELIDSFGDTWNGGEVDVIVDGVNIGSFTLDGIADNGAFNSFDIPVTHLGTIEIIYNPGNWPNENEYYLYAADGTLQFSDNGNPPQSGVAYSGITDCSPAGPTYVYEWTPDSLLNNPNLPNPTASNIYATTTFIASVYEDPYSQCAAVDSVIIGLLGELSAGPDIPGCEMSYQMAAMSYLNNGVWSAPPGSGITFEDPTDPLTVVYADNPGTYVLTWTDPSGNSCPNDDNVTITFLDMIDVDFDIQPPSCFEYCDAIVNANPIGGTVALNYFYEWSNNVQGPGEDEIQNVCAGIHTVTVTDDNGCSFEHDVLVTQPPEVIIDSIISVREECKGYCNGEITVYSAAATEFSFDGGITFLPDNFYDDACQGYHPVIIRDANGCFAEGEVYVDSPTPPIADFDAESGTASVINPLIRFINDSFNNEENIWWFGPAGVFGISTEENPYFIFPDEPGTYSTTLIVVDSLGCLDSLTKTIEIIDELIFYLPNAFSPNGDGLNDFLEPFGGDILESDFQFQIFDRWGRLVFETFDFPFRWNGQGIKNQNYLVDSGVYVWRMQTKRASTTDKIEMLGHLTVIR